MDTQQQREIALETIGNLTFVLTEKLSQLKLSVQQKQELAFTDLEGSRSEFISQLSGWQSDAQKQKDIVLKL